MKTSLNIEDSLARAAQREARRTGRTLSETITAWARAGRAALAGRRRDPRDVKPVDLGGPAAVGLNSRRDWMDVLDL